MSRILEFQPADEQTIVARVLVELHQAIDLNFPNANPGGRQFSKTVLTSQNESTRIDNMPGKGTAGEISGAVADEHRPLNPLDSGKKDPSRPRSKPQPTRDMPPAKEGTFQPLATRELMEMVGPSKVAKLANLALSLTLLVGLFLLIRQFFYGS